MQMIRRFSKVRQIGGAALLVAIAMSAATVGGSVVDLASEAKQIERTARDAYAEAVRRADHANPAERHVVVVLADTVQTAVDFRETVEDYPNSISARREFLRVVAAVGRADRALRMTPISAFVTTDFRRLQSAVATVKPVYLSDWNEQAIRAAVHALGSEVEALLAATRRYASSFPHPGYEEDRRAVGAVGSLHTSVSKLKQAIRVTPVSECYPEYRSVLVLFSQAERLLAAAPVGRPVSRYREQVAIQIKALARLYASLVDHDQVLKSAKELHVLAVRSVTIAVRMARPFDPADQRAVRELRDAQTAAAAFERVAGQTAADPRVVQRSFLVLDRAIERATVATRHASFHGSLSPTLSRIERLVRHLRRTLD